MRFVVLSSGSKGNTTYVECGNTKFLIDIGNNCKYVVDNLKGIGVDPKELNGIFVTHTHVDHIKGLKVFYKRYGTKIYATKKILDELDYIDSYEIVPLSSFSIFDVDVDVIKLSHDAPECVGYVIHNSNKSLVYITDTGYINEKYFPYLMDADAYIMESNHDVDMLSNGRYPFHLRKRILSDKGHISNYDCARYLSLFSGNKTKVVVLAHLSEENNTPMLAYQTLMDRLDGDNKKIDRIEIARQDERIDVIEI